MDNITGVIIMAPPFGFNSSFKIAPTSSIQRNKNKKSQVVPIDNRQQDKGLPSLKQYQSNKYAACKQVLLITDDPKQIEAQKATAQLYLGSRVTIHTLSSTRPSESELFGACTADFVLINYQSPSPITTMLKYIMPDQASSPLIIGINPDTNDQLHNCIQHYWDRHASAAKDTLLNSSDNDQQPNFIKGWYAAPNMWRFLKTEGYLQNQSFSTSYSGSTPRSESPEDDKLLTNNTSIDSSGNDNTSAYQTPPKTTTLCSSKWCGFFCRSTDTQEFDAASPDPETNSHYQYKNQ